MTTEQGTDLWAEQRIIGSECFTTSVVPHSSRFITYPKVKAAHSYDRAIKIDAKYKIMVWSSYGVLGQKLNSGDPQRSTPIKVKCKRNVCKSGKILKTGWQFCGGEEMVLCRYLGTLRLNIKRNKGEGVKQSWSDCHLVDHNHLTVDHVGLIRRKGSRCSLGSDFNSLQDFYSANLLFLESMVTAEEHDSHGKRVMPNFHLAFSYFFWGGHLQMLFAEAASKFSL